MDAYRRLLSLLLSVGASRAFLSSSRRTNLLRRCFVLSSFIMKVALLVLVGGIALGLVFKFVIEPLDSDKKVRVPTDGLRTNLDGSTTGVKEFVVVAAKSPPLNSGVVAQGSGFIEHQVKPVISQAGERTLEEAIAAVQKMETEVFDHAANIFSKEPIDDLWATVQAEKIHIMFDEFPGLERVSVKSLECRERSCQIIAYTPQDRDADYFTAIIFGALRHYQQGELNTPAAITRQMSMGQTAVYVSREGYNLEFYSE